ncbi:small ribosomal subunit protein eS7-like [Cryptomeria japonica]|uniref:small ribosomal subunit protein eS7-like n=1 Tax=Cryptomeria japonica TaxID=3369 RepID=UPI0025AB5DA0|nr:small ribosomal subunit protein eS7-like [Cryptomeria japonica]
MNAEKSGNTAYLNIIQLLEGNVGLIFTKGDLKEVREEVAKYKDDDMIATRRILRPPKKGSAAEIVGKRNRYRVDGSKIMKIYLDPKERNNTEYKLETFAGVCRKFCGKNEVFEYPLSEAS